MRKKFNEILDFFEVNPYVPLWAQLCLMIRYRRRMKRMKREQSDPKREDASKGDDSSPKT